MNINSGTAAYISLEVLIALVAVFGNILVCYVILHSRELRMKVMYMFVTSLAIADLCVGAFAIPFAILTKLGLPYNSPSLCVIMLSFIMIPTQISIFNLMAISLERYLAIRYPRIHYTKLTAGKSLTVILVTWFASILIGLLPLMGWNKLHSSSSGDIRIFTTTNMDQNFTTINSIAFSESNSANPGVTTFTLDGVLTTVSNDDSGLHECIFVEVMEEDYMFFNFVACVLPPLLTSVVLYFVIFLRVTKAYSPSSSPHPNKKKARKEGNSEKSPGFFRKPRIVEPMSSSSPGELSAHDRFNQKEPSSAHESLQQEIEEVGTTNGLIGREHLKADDNPPSSVHNGLPHHDSVSTFNQKYYVDEKALRDSLNTLVKDEKCENENCPSHKRKMSKISKEMDTGTSQTTVSSYMSTPQLLRSRADTNDSEATKKRHHEARHNKRAKEIRAAAVLGLIVLSFAICWLPIHILNTINRFAPTAHIPEYVYDIAILLSHASSAVNFFLYSWRLKAFRIQLHKKLRRVQLFSCLNNN